MEIFKQHQLLVEHNELQRKEKRAEGHLKQKEVKIRLLEEQLKARDEILHSQKQILVNNNVKNWITYKNIRSLDQIEEGARLALPLIKKTYSVKK